ncbi:sulfatase-like hydrolase/transferase [Myxococcota bacterium]|nr:sulfatase-like hydrolase/transferase [Myxococcota bacterium]
MLIVIDTWRADAFVNDLMPALTAYGEGGVVFRNAYSSGNWTLTGTTGILAGTVPSEHELLSQYPEVGEYGWLQDDILLLPDVLEYRSYQVSNNWIAACGGIAERFDVDLNPPPLGMTLEELVDEEVVSQTTPAIIADILGEDRVYFVHYQLLTPHFPYCIEGVDTVVNGFEMCVDTEPLSDEELAQLQADFQIAHAADPDSFLEGMRALYDEQVRQADEFVAGIVEQYRAADLRPLFVVTSDHGEAFLEHDNLFHGDDLHQEQVAVPLIMWGPGVPRAPAVETVVSTVDIFPTLLDFAETVWESDQLIGRSLRPLMHEDAETLSRAQYEYFAFDQETQQIALLSGITASVPIEEGTWTLMEERGDPVLGFEPKLFDQMADPGQVEDLAEDPYFSGVLDTLSELNVVLPHTEWEDRWYGL